MIYEKIVVIDDDPRVIQSLKACLIEYDIVSFNDPNAALKYLSSPNEINLVICDVIMKGCNGLEVLERIKELKKDIGVIMLTGYATQDIILEALRSHADDFVEKPFQVTDLKDRIRNVLRKKNINNADHDEQKKSERIRKFIDRNYVNASLKYIAGEMCLTPKYVSRMFVESSKIGFRKYKLQTKMLEAQRILEHTSRSIGEVAYQLGYKNPESFMRAFKLYSGQTPKEFKQSMKGKHENKNIDY